MTSEQLDIDERFEELSEEEKELLDQALKNLMGFIEEETSLGLWEEEAQED